LQPDPQPVDVIIPSDLKSRIKKLIEELSKDLENAERELQGFLDRNPALIPAIEGVAVAIVVGTLIQDVLTLGTGIADDAATFYIAQRLIHLAKNARLVARPAMGF